MADTEKKIAEIREALEKATPGPWVADDENGIIWSAGAKVVFNFTADEEEGNVNLIANAPEWLRFLLSERDAWARHAVYWKKEERRGRLKLQSAQQEIERLQQERDKLIEGLRWYADSRNWAGDVFAPPEGIPPEVDDGGQRARNILRKIGVTVE